MQQDNTSTACVTGNGSLPGACAAMVFPYVPMQERSPEIYSQSDALNNGTLFPGLNLPFFKTMQSKMNCANQPLCELMALDFAIAELGLYLDTHADDKEAFALYQKYVQMAKDGRAAYEKRYGPLQQAQTASMGSYTWLNNPWPWDEQGGSK